MACFNSFSSSPPSFRNSLFEIAEGSRKRFVTTGDGSFGRGRTPSLKIWHSQENETNRRRRGGHKGKEMVRIWEEKRRKDFLRMDKNVKYDTLAEGTSVTGIREMGLRGFQRTLPLFIETDDSDDEDLRPTRSKGHRKYILLDKGFPVLDLKTLVFF